jgi:deoxyguanosine kinase
MLISIEGCVGIGKTTLVEQCTRLFHCTPVYEQPERNPFLADFYQAHDKRAWAKPLLSTFLFLQERQLRQALPFAEQGHLVLCDFHPLKNLVFARALLETSEQARLADLYQGLCIPQPDLVIYLKADEPTILSRIRKKPDPFEPSLDLTFITQITWAYDTFFRSVYKGRALAVDTSRLDYYERAQDLHVPLQTMQEALDLLPYLQTGPASTKQGWVPGAPPGRAASQKRTTPAHHGDERAPSSR